MKTAMGPEEQKLRDAVKKRTRCFEDVDDAVSAAKDVNENSRTWFRNWS